MSLRRMRLGALDPARHQIAVRAFAEGSLEATREMARRHRHVPREGRHVERLVELAIHAVLGLAQSDEIGNIHGNAMNNSPATCPSEQRQRYIPETRRLPERARLC